LSFTKKTTIMLRLMNDVFLFLFLNTKKLGFIKKQAASLRIFPRNVPVTGSLKLLQYGHLYSGARIQLENVNRQAEMSADRSNNKV